MNAEYKRDMNHNYLILHGDEEIDTSSYQVRMLVGNVIPSLARCRIQGMNGKFSVYYDITSRQSLTAFYEGRRMNQDDLRLIFGEFIRVMEDAAEYLMNPGQLVLMPEYMFLEIEKREISFCFLPGYQRDMKEQFQALTEYVLPKINHEDDMAVMIGYGIYRRALEDSFQLEHIKEELYRGREGEAVNDDSILSHAEKKEDTAKNIAVETSMVYEKEAMEAEEELWSRNESRCEDSYTKVNRTKNSHAIWKKAACFLACILILAVVLSAKMSGYLPQWKVSTILGSAIAAIGSGMLIYTVIGKIRKKKHTQEVTTGLRRVETMKEEEWFREPCTEERSDTVPVRGNITAEDAVRNCGETVVLSMGELEGPPTLVSREPGELAPIYLEKEFTVVGKLETAADAVIDLPTVSRVHAKIRKKGKEYYLTDLNSRNGTTVNGRLLKAEEEYCLQNEDEVDFAQARYVFLSRNTLKK